MADSSGIAAGTWIGPYEILSWLGAGGMGVVYRARDTRLDREVAIKFLPHAYAADSHRVSRFEQEARAAGRLSHPNILAVHDVGVFDGAPFIVSELLEGESLRSRLQGGALSIRKAIDFAHQVAEGLAAAHEKNIVHRDVKPDNLFVTRDGRVKILDFGIAKLTRSSDDVTTDARPTETGAGMVIGTPNYMSPEQVRGEPVDHRSDIFSLGIVLYEVLAKRSAFGRETAADTMVAILKEEPSPALPPEVPPALALIVSRCLEKSREMRFQSARDLAFGLKVLADPRATTVSVPAKAAPRRWVLGLGAAVVALGVLMRITGMLSPSSPSIESRFMNATFTPFTNFPGSEFDAALSPDGRFVSFMSDQSGPFHAWLKQVGTGPFVDLTPGPEDRRNPGPNRNVGFSADGSEIWINGIVDGRLGIMPLTGGTPRVFLMERAINAVWSPDGTQLACFTAAPGDPLYIADRSGNDARQLVVGKPGEHNHFLAWSPDGEWIYYAHGLQAVAEYDVWRIPSAGGTPEQLTTLRTNIRYLTPIDARTLLFVAPAEDRSGPWLWALDVESKVTRRVSVGLERYLSVAGSADGRRLVATVAKSTAALWQVPMLDRLVEERDVTPYPVPVARALAPRFGDASVYFLSSSGPGDGLWRLQDGKAVEIWKGSDEPLLESPSVSPRGDQVAIVLRKERRLHLALLHIGGGPHRSLAEAIDVRGTSAWSPDARWIVTGGSDAQGPGLFRISVTDGTAVALVRGGAFDPTWSSDGSVIVYVGQRNAYAPLLAVRPDGSPVGLPEILVPAGGGGRARFLPNGQGLVYMQGPEGARDFWLLDLTTSKSRRLTQLTNRATMSTFDITPDGQQIVFDRLREDSDLRLIDLPR
ncbi:MAG: protein kinase [Vicinamibacterales bacterium]